MIIAIVASLILGFYIGKTYVKYKENLEESKIKITKNKLFKLILDHFNKNNSIFNRVNNNIYITTEFRDLGLIDILYMIDTQDIAILKDEHCIENSSLVNKELIKQFEIKIAKLFDEEINDTIDVFGLKLYRREFERILDNSFEEIKNKLYNKQDNESEIKKIIDINQNKFDMDEILDKISRVGIHNLSPEEIYFLKNFNNEK